MTLLPLAVQLLLVLPLVVGLPDSGEALTDLDLLEVDAYVKKHRMPFTVGRNPATRRKMSELCGLVVPTPKVDPSKGSVKEPLSVIPTDGLKIGAKGGKANTNAGFTTNTGADSPSPAEPSPSRSPIASPSIPPSPTSQSPSPAAPPPVGSPSPWSLPTAFDWRSQMSVVPPVRNQGGCGACWAFAMVGQLEMLTAINAGVITDFSEQYLVSCSSAFGLSYSCGGGFFYAHVAHRLVASNDGHLGGIRSESCYPYMGQSSACTWDCDGVDSISSWTYADAANNANPSFEAVKNAIYSQGPVAVTVFVSSTFQSYTGGIYTDNPAASGPNHGVVLIGWGVDPVVGEYWIVRNSWGSGWGEKGYMRIKFGVSLIGGYANYAVNSSGTNIARSAQTAPSPSVPVSAPNDEAGPSIAWVTVAVVLVVAISGIAIGVFWYHRLRQQRTAATVFVTGADADHPSHIGSGSPQWTAKLTPGAPCNTQANYTPL